MDEWIKKMQYTYKGILFSHEKEGNPAICDSMDGPWGHYAKWNKPDRERQMLPGFTYMWNQKTKKNKKVKLIETEIRKVVSRGWGVERGW